MSTTELPIIPFDGMKFTDSWRRQWEYSAETTTWIFKGYLPNIPLADESTIGLLSSSLKGLLDSIPEKAGGFGIFTKYSFGKVQGDELSGLMTGDITLKSNTLEIRCRDLNGKLITKTCATSPSSQETNQIPSIDINFSETFLDTLCIEVPGSKGPKGITGKPGLDGEDGFGDGPVGLEGAVGLDASGISEVDKVVIEIDDSFYDTAVVNVELDSQNSILSVTKAKLAVPDDTTPADRFIVMPIARSLEWTTGTSYNILAPSNENLGLDADVGVLAYPIDFNPELTGEDVEMSRKALSDFINQIIADYKVLYDKYIVEYDQEIKDFMFNKDTEARKVLDSLVATLAAKQFSETFEYCMGLADNGTCGQQMLKAIDTLTLSVQSGIDVLAVIAANTGSLEKMATCTCEAAAAAGGGDGGGDGGSNPTASAIYDINDINGIIEEINKAINSKTGSPGFNFQPSQVTPQTVVYSSPEYSSDLCNYASQILEASGEVTFGDVCPGIQSKLLAKIDLAPGTKYYIKNGVGGKELPKGAYLIQFINGAVYDGSQQDCGYMVGSGNVTRGLVMNVESNNVITQIPMPQSSQVTDPHDKNQVINSYLTGPITEMAIGAFANENDKIWLEFLVNKKEQSTGSISLYIKFCARCDK
jgi:hypothetical protein